MMKVAIITFDGFNEMDSFVALNMLGRLKHKGLKVSIVSDRDHITSMNGVTIQVAQQLESAADADAVIIGSGIYTRDIVQNSSIVNRLKLDPSRQLIASQCSGVLLMQKLGLVTNMPVCSDSKTKPWAIEAGLNVIDQPFYARYNVSTAGGCLSSQYLSAWIISKLFSIDDAIDVVEYIAPVGQKDAYVEMMKNVVQPFIEYRVSE